MLIFSLTTTIILLIIRIFHYYSSQSFPISLLFSSFSHNNTALLQILYKSSISLSPATFPSEYYLYIHVYSTNHSSINSQNFGRPPSFTTCSEPNLLHFGYAFPYVPTPFDSYTRIEWKRILHQYHPHFNYLQLPRHITLV